MEEVLKVINISKHYNGTQVINGVSFILERGKIYGFVGNNGAGKTTLIRIIAGVVNASGGEIVLFGGSKPKELQSARKKVGFIIENPIYNEGMTARQNLQSLCILKGIKDKNEISRVLALAGLDEAAINRKKVKDFSLGMKQRYAIAAALLGDPELLVLDEPINGLDPQGVVDIRELLKSLKDRNKTILISSHIIAELYNISTDYIFIDHGQIIKTASKDELDEAIENEGITLEEYFLNIAGKGVC